MLIGRIIGKTSPEKFQFEVSGIIKKMDFVATRDTERHWVLGRVEGIYQDGSKTIANVSVIGYTNKRGQVSMPKLPFKPGSFIYKADDGLIKKVLGLKSTGLYIGLLDGSENLKVHLDPKKLITKHLAVLAKTGTGKSYFVSVILEEFMENNIPAVVIDPHGEYLTLQHENKKQEEVNYMPRFDIKPKGYKKELQLFCLEKNLVEGAKKLKFNGRFGYQELFEMLPFRLTGNQLNVIYSVIRDVDEHGYTLEDLKQKVQQSTSRAKWGVLSVIDFLRSVNLFDTSRFIRPEDLVKRGKISVINLKGIEPDVQQLVTYKLAKMLFDARKSNRIPPFLFVVEEAQNFCPERGFGEAVSSRILRTIASEGRKFGMGLTIVSQRAARVDKNVLSQCNTQVFLRVNNPNDLKAIVDSMEGVTHGILSQIKTLPIGTAVVTGLIDQPLVVDVRIKRSNHGGTLTMPTRKIQEEEGDILYFYPKFLEEDIKKSIRKKLEQFKLIYYPLWRLRCKFSTPEGEKIDNIFIDGLNGELVFWKNDTLMRTSGLPSLLRLDMKKKAVLLFLTTYGMSSAGIISKKLKMSESGVNNILVDLIRQDLVKKDKDIYKSMLNLNFGEIIENQITESTVNYKYSGEMLDFNVTKEDTKKVLDLFRPNAFERKKCYYPYWFIFYDDGNVDIVDALTGKKDKFLMKTDILDNLSI